MQHLCAHQTLMSPPVFELSMGTHQGEQSSIHIQVSLLFVFRSTFKKSHLAFTSKRDLTNSREEWV